MSLQPKYQQVEEYLKGEIAAGRLKPGDQIMTEEQLCEQFSFSRMTISKALSHLHDLGYIKRIPGKGSFVTPPRVSKSTNSGRSFTQDMCAVGMEAGAKLISYNVLCAGDIPDIMEKLKLSEEDLVHYFVRLRTGNGTPIAVSHTYVLVQVVPAINVECLSHSFYEYLDTLGIERKVSRQEFRATLPTPEQKDLLNIDHTALLCSAHVTNTIFDGRSVPFEYTETYYSGEMYTYVMDDQ